MYGSGGNGGGSLKQLKQKEFETNNADLENGDNQQIINDKVASFIQVTKTFIDPENLSYKGVFNSIIALQSSIALPDLGDYAFTRADNNLYICGTLGSWNINLNANLNNEITILLDGVPTDGNTLKKLNDKIIALQTSKQDKIYDIKDTTANILAITNISNVGKIAFATDTGKTYLGTDNSGTLLWKITLQAELDLKQNITDNTLSTTSKTIVGAINENKANIDLKVDKSVIKTAFSPTTLDTNIISEKLAKDQLDLKANDNTVVKLTGDQTVADIKTFSSSPILSSLTASQRLELDASKNIISVAKKTADNRDFETLISNIQMDGSVSVGISNNIARADHIHPSDTSKENVSNKATDFSTINNNLYPTNQAVNSFVTNYAYSKAQTDSQVQDGVQYFQTYVPYSFYIHGGAIVFDNSTNIINLTNKLVCIKSGTVNGITFTKDYVYKLNQATATPDETMLVEFISLADFKQAIFSRDFSDNSGLVYSGGTYQKNSNGTGIELLATQSNLDLKQNITDNALNTTSKTIPGAINELNSLKTTKQNEFLKTESQVEMLASDAIVGDIAIRNDNGSLYQLQSLPASTLINWKVIASSSGAISIPSTSVTKIYSGGSLPTSDGLYAFTATPGGGMPAGSVGDILQLSSSSWTIDQTYEAANASIYSNFDGKTYNKKLNQSGAKTWVVAVEPPIYEVRSIGDNTKQGGYTTLQNAVNAYKSDYDAGFVSIGIIAIYDTNLNETVTVDTVNLLIKGYGTSTRSQTQISKIILGANSHRITLQSLLLTLTNTGSPLEINSSGTIVESGSTVGKGKHVFDQVSYSTQGTIAVAINSCDNFLSFENNDFGNKIVNGSTRAGSPIAVNITNCKNGQFVIAAGYILNKAYSPTAPVTSLHASSYLLDLDNATPSSYSLIRTATALGASVYIAKDKLIINDDTNGNLETLKCTTAYVASANLGVGTAIDLTKYTTSRALTSAKILVGNSSNKMAEVSVSGDATVSNTGALTISNNAVTNSKLAQMANMTVKANISGSAANPSDTSLTNLNTASSVVFRDANKNAAINALTTSYSEIETAAGTTNLLISSAREIRFTGTTTQEVNIPDATTLIVNDKFKFKNDSTGSITIKDSTGSTITIISSGVEKSIILTNNSIAVGTWSIWAISSGGGGSGTPGGTNGQIQYNDSGAFGGFTLGGDGTVDSTTGVLTVSKLNNGSLPTSKAIVGTNSSGQIIDATTSALPTAMMPALTGDITNTVGSLATTIANDVITTAKILDNNVTNAKLAQVATATIKGRTTSGTGNVEDLTVTQTTAMLNAFTGDSGSGGVKGLVPAPATGDASAGKYLKADGTWAVVSVSNKTYWAGTTAQQLSIATDSPGSPIIATLVPGKSWTTGKTLILKNSDSNYLRITITSYDSGEGTAQIERIFASGSGIYSNWDVYEEEPATNKYASFANAISRTISAQISALTAKTTLVDADVILGENSANSFSKIKTAMSNVYTYISGKILAATNTFTGVNTFSNASILMTNLAATTGSDTTSVVSMKSDGTLIKNNYTEWTTWTATVKGVTSDPSVGSGGTIRGAYKVVGKSLFLQFSLYQVNAGSAGSGDYYVPLPSGFTINTSIATIGTSGVLYRDGTVHGYGVYDNNATLAVSISVTPYSSSAVIMCLNTEFGSTNWNRPIASSFGGLSSANMLYRWTAELPIN